MSFITILTLRYVKIEVRMRLPQQAWLVSKNLR